VEVLLNDEGESGFRLQDAIERAVAAVSEIRLDKAVGIVAEYPAHLPPVDGDQNVIAQLLAQLIQVVMLNTTQTEVRVSVQIRPPSGELPSELQIQGDSSGSPLALISISDMDPIPFAVEVQAATIEAHASGNLKVQEALHLIREELDARKGCIWLDPGTLSGIRVWFALPVSVAESTPQELERMRKIIQTRLPNTNQAGQLLLIHVEDQALRNLLARELTEQGYRVLASTQPGEIISLARANVPDLIILDLQARTPTAFDIAMLLKQDRRTQLTPILFLTAIQDQGGSVRMEMANFLIRPEGTGAILATVEAVLSSGIHPTARVMVVEPDKVLRENIILHIQARGFPVIEASSPEESVALAERVNVGIVLVNADLAQERDYWLLRQLRVVSEELEIYVIAEALSEEEGQAAMIRGASGYGETRQLPELLDRVEGEKEPQ
jgi:DNA-binding response OmpR family regulator